LNYKCSHDGNLGDCNRSLPEVISFADHCPGTLSAIQPGVQDTASKRQGKKLCSFLFSLFTLYRDSLFFPHIKVPSLQGNTTPHHTTPHHETLTQHNIDHPCSLKCAAAPFELARWLWSFIRPCIPEAWLATCPQSPRTVRACNLSPSEAHHMPSKICHSSDARGLLMNIQSCAAPHANVCLIHKCALQCAMHPARLACSESWMIYYVSTASPS